jgi:hypothetical protein
MPNTPGIPVHHTAVKVEEIKWYVDFFEEVFGMSVTAKSGDEGKPEQVWLSGGIQLVLTDEPVAKEGILHHMGFIVDDIDGINKRIAKWNLKEVMPDWYALPNGLVIELKAKR